MSPILRPLAVAVAIMAMATAADAKTLVLKGSLSARIKVTQRVTFAVSEPKSSLTYKFSLPAQGETKSVSQQIRGLQVDYFPEPATVTEETDRFGNRFRTVNWRNLTGDARVVLAYEAAMKSELRAMESRAPFPLGDLQEAQRLYLQAAEQVQSDEPAIKTKARELVAGAATEYEAVTAIMRFVANHITYGYNPPRADALYSLQTGDGNCQNYAHLALALLRAAGIPGRVVGGYTLREQWKIPVDNRSSLVQGMGQGGHAWLEIYFPDLGWLSYDPQQSMQFTSTRHIKQTHGLQVKEVVDTWRAVPPLPQYSELTEAVFVDDQITLAPSGEAAEPRGYLVSNPFSAGVPSPSPMPLPQPSPSAPPVKPPPIKPQPASLPAPKPPQKPAPLPPQAPAKEEEILIGNMKFPSLVEVYQTVGDTGSRILDKETAEYVTSRNIYAQAFTVQRPMRITAVSLAMKKFGGDGTLYLDIVTDDGGKPGLTDGMRTRPVFLEEVRRTPGYGWLDFPISVDTPPFRPGKYWLVLRHSGEAVMNWFYTPGKRFGDPEDTRSTARGWQWEDILNYDFVFKVAARPVP